MHCRSITPSSPVPAFCKVGIYTFFITFCHLLRSKILKHGFSLIFKPTRIQRCSALLISSHRKAVVYIFPITYHVTALPDRHLKARFFILPITKQWFTSLPSLFLLMFYTTQSFQAHNQSVVRHYHISTFCHTATQQAFFQPTSRWCFTSFSSLFNVTELCHKPSPADWKALCHTFIMCSLVSAPHNTRFMAVSPSSSLLPPLARRRIQSTVDHDMDCQIEARK